MENSVSKPTLEKKKAGWTRNLVLTVFVSCVFSGFQHGYNTGVVNAPQKLIEEFISSVQYARYGVYPVKSTITLIFSIIVSAYCIGGMVGGLLTAYIADKFGRKKGLIFNNILVFAGGIMMGLSKYANSYELLVAGRFFIGINSGLNAGLAPLYLSEISPVHLRGAIGTLYQLMITVTILMSQLFGLPQIFGTSDLWPVLFGFVLVPAVIMIITMPFCPETPKYILIKQGKEESAQKVLTWLRGGDDIFEEMDAMKAEYEILQKEPTVTLGELWRNSALRQPLIIGIVMMLSQQFSGINAVFYFSTDIFLGAGLNTQQALYATLFVGVINVVMTIIVVALIEKLGRRTLHLFGLSGMLVTTIALTIGFTFKNQSEVFSYLSIACIVIFVCTFAVGPGPIPWFIVNELFGQGARPMASSIAVTVNWVANFVVGLVFLPLSGLLQNYTFLVFTVTLAIFIIFTYKKVPETKNKTIEEISAIFSVKTEEKN